MSKSRSRHVSKKTKEIIMKKQYETCANIPGSNIRFIGNYQCPCWQYNQGSLSKGKYDLDHIKEYSLGGSNEEHNLQYLCLYCHREKTTNFMKYKTERDRAKREYLKKLAEIDSQFGIGDDDDDKCSIENVETDKNRNIMRDNTIKRFMRDCYEKTDNSKDRVHKHNVMIRYRQYVGNNNMIWSDLLRAIDDLHMGYKYKKQVRISDGTKNEDGRSPRGCFVGLIAKKLQ